MSIEIDIDYTNYIYVGNIISSNMTIPIAHVTTSGKFCRNFEELEVGYHFRELISYEVYGAVDNTIRHKLFISKL